MYENVCNKDFQLTYNFLIVSGALSLVANIAGIQKYLTTSDLSLAIKDINKELLQWLLFN